MADGDLEALEQSGLAEGEVGGEALELAARSGHEDVLQWLLSRSGDAQLQESAGAAALAAARGGHLAVLELLLGRGCECVLAPEAAITFPDGTQRGDAPLHEAACCGQAEAVAWLLERGADARALDAAGREPLHLAALHGQPGVAAALLAAAADPNAARGRGSAALAQAAFNGHGAVVGLLLEARARAGARDALGMEALQQAALRGHAQLVNVLLGARADLAARDGRGRAALHHAAQGYAETDASAVPDLGFPSAPNANLAAVRALLKARADANTEDGEGRLPLDYAVERGHTKVAKLLSEWSELQTAA